MILVLTWHRNSRYVFFVDQLTGAIQKKISLARTPFDFFKKISNAEFKSAKGLCIVFGMKLFSSTRQVTLLANLFAAVYKKKIYQCTVEEDAPWNIVQNSVLRCLKSKGRSVLVPQYSSLPHITSKK